LIKLAAFFRPAARQIFVFCPLTSAIFQPASQPSRLPAFSHSPYPDEDDTTQLDSIFHLKRTYYSPPVQEIFNMIERCSPNQDKCDQHHQAQNDQSEFPDPAPHPPDKSTYRYYPQYPDKPHKHGLNFASSAIPAIFFGYLTAYISYKKLEVKLFINPQKNEQEGYANPQKKVLEQTTPLRMGLSMSLTSTPAQKRRYEIGYGYEPSYNSRVAKGNKILIHVYEGLFG
jgi:hypothetical protein